MTASQVLDEVLSVSAAYRDRHHEWPAEIRLDAARLHTLVAGYTSEDFASIAAHVRLSIRDSPGVSAGGRGVVQLGKVTSGASSIELARVWMGDVDVVDGKISCRREYWRELAHRALEKYPDIPRLGAEEMVLAHQLTPERIEAREDEARREELLFQATYVASFGINGVHPKTLAFARWSYGLNAEYPEPSVMLRRADGFIAMVEPPWAVFELFPATRDDFTQTVARFGEAMTDVARRLAR
jgi:hypothetical protein